MPNIGDQKEKEERAYYIYRKRKNRFPYLVYVASSKASVRDFVHEKTGKLLHIKDISQRIKFGHFMQDTYLASLEKKWISNIEDSKIKFE